MDTNLAPPKIFCRGITSAGNWCILWLTFMKPNDLAFTSEGVRVAKKLVSNEGSSRREKATFRPRSYCKSLIEVLEKYVRLLGTYVNLQFAVQLANLLAFDEEPLGIQHSNLYVRERNTLFEFTWYLNHFSLEQCFGESLSKFCVMSTLRRLNLEIALSAYFGNRRLSTKPRTKRGWEDHCRNIFSRLQS